MLGEPIENGLQRRNVFEQGRKGVAEHHQIPLSDLGLMAVSISTSAGVGGVGCPVGIVILEPAVRPVVDGEAEDGHIVGVHHTVDEADAHPVDDHICRTATDLVIHRDDRVG